MSITQFIKEKLLKSIIHTSISFKILTLAYLIFLIIWQLTTPTTAYFTDTKIHHVTLVSAGSFGDEIEDSPSEDPLIDEEVTKSKSDNQTAEETNKDTIRKKNVEDNNNTNQNKQSQKTPLTEEKSEKTDPSETVKSKKDEKKSSNENRDIDGKQNEQDNTNDNNKK